MKKRSKPKHPTYPPATADRGATPENVADALLRPLRPIRKDVPSSPPEKPSRTT